MTDRLIPPLRHSRLRVRGGAILLERRGPLNFMDQRVGKFAGRAPETRGLWAFPYPFHDDFFSYHKFDEVIPKRLTRDAINAVYEAGGETGPLHDERQEWIRKHGSRTQPIRRFWWTGSLYARFDRYGRSPMGIDWHLLSVDEFESAARRVEPGHGNFWGRDHMEVFCAPGRGKILGRAPR